MQSRLLRNKVLCSIHPSKLFHFAKHPKYQETQLRSLHDDGRQRLSQFWVPTGGIAPSGGSDEDSHSKLIRGGFLRQAQSGLFQFLPLGLRVQEKLERLLDKHMGKLGASKVSLSTFSSEALWEQSGRLKKSSELFRLRDRRGQKYLLSPTHEEEITSIVGGSVKSYKDLPLMLYQITRKYRDEPRPRQGLLRTREFLMKDLYTFDSTKEKALKSYETVRRAYNNFFDEFKIPYLIAEADSGDIGGDLSHEYHFPTSRGEDSILSCGSCSLVANEEEVAKLQLQPRLRIDSCEAKSSPGELSAVSGQHKVSDDFCSWYGVSQDRSYLVEVVYPSDISLPTKPQINPSVVKLLFPELDLSVENAFDTFTGFFISAQAKGNKVIPKVLQTSDHRVPHSQFVKSAQATIAKLSNLSTSAASRIPYSADTVQAPAFSQDPDLSQAPDLLRLQTGSPCPKCASGILKSQTAVELGHTFYLGTKYSKPLSATIALDPATISNPESHTGSKHLKKVPLQMGCHGIGVSRLIGAVADSLADETGLNWPRVMAPFEVIVIGYPENAESAEEVYDSLTNGGEWVEFASADGGSRAVWTAAPTSGKPIIDVLLDDRDKGFVWKLKDADLIGYPVIVALGKRWRKENVVEVQCRQLNFKGEVPVVDVRVKVEDLLRKL